MIQPGIALALAGLLFAQGTPTGDRYRAGVEELAIYRLGLQDVLTALADPTGNWRAGIALDPYLRAPEAPPPEGPGSFGLRLTDSTAGVLLRAGGIRQVCEPSADFGCRGGFRGLVIRLTPLEFASSDTARMVLIVTRARAELDRAMLLPDVRYFGYRVVREWGRWVVRRSYRGLRAWREP